MVGLFDKLDFDVKTEVGADGVRTVIVDVTRKRPWTVYAEMVFTPQGEDNAVLRVKEPVDDSEKQFLISGSEIQTGSFDLRVYSYGPLGIVGRREGEVVVP